MAIRNISLPTTGTDPKSTTSEDLETEVNTSLAQVYTDLQPIVAEGAFTDGDKTKLDGIAAEATANATDADLRDRTTHTGEQAISTVTDLQDELDAKADDAATTAALALKADENSIDPRDAAKLGDNPSTIPAATSENIIVTSDGYVMLSRDGETVKLGTALFDIDGGFDPFAVKTPDGYNLMAVRNDGSVDLAGATFDIDPFREWEVQTADGGTVIGLDQITGGVKAVLSEKRFELSGPESAIAGRVRAGAVSGVMSSGDWFAYDFAGEEFTGKVIGRNLDDWTSPHMADAPVFDVLECDGQSWQTIADYTPTEVDFEETSGETSAALRSAISPMVSTLRRENYVGVTVDDGSYDAEVPTISNGSEPGDLHRFDPAGQYSIGRISAVTRARFQRRLGISANPSVVLNVGWPGQSGDKFLPEGVSYGYTDDSGSAQTTTAALVSGELEYLWARNIDTRDSIASFIVDKWFNRNLRYEFLTWIQGPFEDGGNALAFMQEYRTQQDALAIPNQTGTRHIMWDQGNGLTSRTVQHNGLQAQVDFCQTNASGKDWLVGPRYPHFLRDNIHHSSFGALEYAERTGQAMAYVQKYGDWEPFWITNVSFSGADCILTVNDPRQCTDDVVIDTDAIEAAANSGFTLWNDTGGTEIPITGVAISGNTITLSTAGTLSGDIEVGYAARGVAQTDGTVSVPQHVGCWGNIKRAGRDAPSIIPTVVQPTLDHWLCTYKKVHTV